MNTSRQEVYHAISLLAGCIYSMEDQSYEQFFIPTVRSTAMLCNYFYCTKLLLCYKLATEHEVLCQRFASLAHIVFIFIVMSLMNRLTFT